VMLRIVECIDLDSEAECVTVRFLHFLDRQSPFWGRMRPPAPRMPRPSEQPEAKRARATASRTRRFGQPVNETPLFTQPPDPAPCAPCAGEAAHAAHAAHQPRTPCAPCAVGARQEQVITPSHVMVCAACAERARAGAIRLDLDQRRDNTTPPVSPPQAGGTKGGRFTFRRERPRRETNSERRQRELIEGFQREHERMLALIAAEEAEALEASRMDAHSGSNGAG
jgi:hypothetical protein